MAKFNYVLIVLTVVNYFTQHKLDMMGIHLPMGLPLLLHHIPRYLLVALTITAGSLLRVVIHLTPKSHETLMMKIRMG